MGRLLLNTAISAINTGLNTVKLLLDKGPDGACSTGGRLGSVTMSPKTWLRSSSDALVCGVSWNDQLRSS